MEVAHRPPEELAAFKELNPKIGFGLGVVDIKRTDVETPEQIARAIERAEKTLAPQVREALEFMAVSIRKFHEDQKPEEMWFHEIRPGVFAGDRTTASPSVACYIPRGKGAFPSSVLMQSIPATVAGVSK